MEYRKRPRDSEEVRKKRVERARAEAEKGRAEYDAEAEALRKRTARLKELRETREATDRPHRDGGKKPHKT